MSDIVPEIQNRRAYRALDPRKIPAETIDRILAAGTLAPSCANNQPWRFIAVTDSQVLARIKEHLTPGNYWAKLSPFIVLVCTRPEDDCRSSERRDYALFDTGLATSNMLLQGVREGLYTHPIAGFSPQPIREIAGIPDDFILVTLVIFGYPGDIGGLSEKHLASERSERLRKEEGETIAYDRWPPGWSTADE